MSKRNLVLLKSAVWMGCLAPLGRLVGLGFTGGLGANPIEFITLSTGTWTLVFLLATLGITPLRRLSGQNWLIKFRRLIGLFAFFYGCLHFTTYIWLDKFFSLADMLKDVAKRPFITAGFSALLLLIPLAATSTARSIRRLGRRWQLLHRLIYISAAAAVIHFWWKVKADTREPAIYAAILAALLLYRIFARLSRPRASIGFRPSPLCTRKSEGSGILLTPVSKVPAALPPRQSRVGEPQELTPGSRRINI